MELSSLKPKKTKNLLYFSKMKFSSYFWITAGQAEKKNNDKNNNNNNNNNNNKRKIYSEMTTD